MTVETKFSIGDTVFFMWNNEVSSGTISALLVNKSSHELTTTYVIPYRFNTVNLPEDKIFPSKEELLQNL